MKNYKQNMIVGWYDIFEGINDKTKIYEWLKHTIDQLVENFNSWEIEVK